MPTDKYPWMKFHTGDWLKDPALSKCSPATRGIWIDLLAAMHEDGRTGKMSGEYTQLARVCRCTIDELKIAVDELRSTGTADTESRDVTLGNSAVTLINRRMLRDAKLRQQTKLRVSKHRRNGACNASVTGQKPRNQETKIRKLALSSPPEAVQPAKKERPKNAIWDAVCERFGLTPVLPAECTRIGKVVRDLTAKGATPAEVPIRCDNYRRHFDGAALTPEALVKHWDQCGAPPADRQAVKVSSAELALKRMRGEA